MLRPDLYAAAAPDLIRAQLGGVLPLPFGKKFPPPAGFTGREAPYPDEAQAGTWMRDHAAYNIGVRLGRNIVGVDVDAYGDKLGAKSWQQLVDECGEAPTWMVSSYDATDGTRAGIRLYTAPDGVTWSERQAGPGIELIHHGHRYIVAPPSIHPSGRRYRWVAPDGTEREQPPTFQDLTRMPATWGRRLSIRPHVAQAAKLAPVRSGSGYAAVTFERTIQDLAVLGPGGERNWNLNKAAYKLGGLVGAGLLDEHDVQDALYDAAISNGHISKHGRAKTLASIRSGLTKGQTRPRTGAAA